jgi:hypothetical protein
MKLQSFYDKGLPALDDILVARINGLKQKLIVSAVLVAALLLIAGYLFYSFFLITNGGMMSIKRVRPGNLWVVVDGSIVQRVGFSSCTVNASAMDKSPVHRTSLWTAASRCVTCPPLLDLKPTV